MGGIIAAIPGATAQGLVWGVMALGVYVTYKLLDIADLTVDSSLCTGGATSAVLILMGMHPLLSLVFAVFAGMLAGLVTGFLHTRLRIPAILAGILTQLGLYSINLRIMGKSSVALLRQPVVISLGNIPMALLIGVLVAAAVVAVMYWFFGTELGCAIRATGNNRKMVRAQGVNTDTMKIIGLVLSNGLVGLAGGEGVSGMLELKNIHKVFNPGTINEKRAIQNLSFTLNDGDFVTVIGGNGAGKSTMLNLIAGVYTADAGSIVLDGADITKLPEYKRAKLLGRVFQDPMMGTAGNMGIEENLAMAYRRGRTRTLRWGISNEEREFYKEKLQMLDLGLEGRLTSKVRLLSGGQRQALTLLMATLQNPRLLLLDEHTAALDPKTAHKVLTLTEKIISENRLSTLMVTHNMKDAIRYGNRLVMMHEGNIIYDVSGEEKANLQVSDLLAKFEAVSNGEFANDRMLLA